MDEKKMYYEEKTPRTSNGMAALFLITLLILASWAAFAFGIVLLVGESGHPLGIAMVIIGALYGFLIGWIPYAGLKILKPNEALVLTLFGKYYGTIKREGFFFVNPFVTAVNPTAGTTTQTATAPAADPTKVALAAAGVNLPAGSLTLGGSKKISLKVITLNNERQKINDMLGNPIVIGIVVVWRVVNPTKAVFNVDNYKEFLSIQCDSALRNIVRLYPYDTHGDDNEKTLRGSSQEIAIKLKDEIQEKVHVAGIEIGEARITHLAYAPEIASAMLQRQQASAVIDAKQMIVENAVGMVEMAIAKLSAKNIVALDDERKAAMVSNLMVILCGSRDAQPVINSGSLY
ncbi:MAG: SPFH domain-containing protein [Defluviitaleaceae bacterium]|nr:SPFH domain-containing protein [Defluviitaleaceae bacterium]